MTVMVLQLASGFAHTLSAFKAYHWQII